MPRGQGHQSSMTSQDASRIQSSQAKSGGDMSSGGFAARAQSAGARNENAGYSQGGGDQNATTQPNASKQ
ncbi:hypothetical protein B0I35DRAFT_437571 [Stachybotrys elegans]|uniref:SMP domain-containing protein n=1 Tax=Stachybotrys elegans TaxID=80388 RepID=A0A8K0SMR4_9HYPO|nr:hypothetical protein B0I35DRAFT_437571 [Stachybotrys elegans]